MYFHLKGFITDVIIQINAPVKYDNQGSKSLSLQTIIYLWQTVSETVDSVSICAQTTGKRISNNCFVVIETFVQRRRDVTKPLSSIGQKLFDSEKPNNQRSVNCQLICLDFPDGRVKECGLNAWGPFKELLAIILAFTSIVIT